MHRRARGGAKDLHACKHWYSVSLVTTRRSPQPRTLLARPDRIIEYAARHGWQGDTEMASAFGVSRKTVWRVLHATRRPSVQFIAGVLASSPDADINGLFENVEE